MQGNPTNLAGQRVHRPRRGELLMRRALRRRCSRVCAALGCARRERRQRARRRACVSTNAQFVPGRLLDAAPDATGPIAMSNLGVAKRLPGRAEHPALRRRRDGDQRAHRPRGRHRPLDRPGAARRSDSPPEAQLYTFSTRMSLSPDAAARDGDADRARRRRGREHRTVAACTRSRSPRPTPPGAHGHHAGVGHERRPRSARGRPGRSQRHATCRGRRERLGRGLGEGAARACRRAPSATPRTIRP